MATKKVISWLFFLVFFSNYYTCLSQKSNTKEATIIFEVKNHKSNQLVLSYSHNFLNWTNDTLQIVNDLCKKTFLLSNPIYIDVRNADGLWGYVFLAPHYQSKITIDCSKNTKNYMLFEGSGDGAIANNYHNEIKPFRSPISTQKQFNGQLLTEEEFIAALNKYYSKRDSVHKYFQNLALKTSVQDKYLKIFFEAEKAENEFDRASRILSFIENRHYKTKEAERIFVGYIAPSRILDQKINLYSPRSRSFFRTYLVDYFMARKRETDTVTVRKIGHYAMVLDYMAKNYTATSKSYSILSTLLFLTEGVRSYPAHLPPIDSLIRIYEQHISPQDRKLIWNTYRKNKAMLSAIYAEGQKIDVFNIEDGNGKQIELKSKLSEVTVIDLWASWCTNCIEAFPVGDSLEKEYKDNKRVSFVRLSLDDKKETWQKSVKRLNIDLGNSFWIEGGMKSIFAKKFDVHYLPSWLVVAKNGQVLKMYMPHIAERNRFKAAIDKFLVLK